jgi:23S rRNA (cytosine1962-C5)-methyltransferase
VNFLRLPDHLPTVLFEDSDIIAIDKPYGFNAHTNDSKIEHSDFIQDGLIEIYEKHLNRKLHIIHRLDQTTTGVMIFGKSVESAKKYAEFFFEKQVKKTYLFLTKSVSTKNSFLVDDIIVHKGRELEAETQFSLISKSNSFELWKAKPKTGRNHQIRIHAKSAQIPILGDEKYGGFQFPFLCLHNQQIEFPNGIVIQSKPPVYFEKTEFLKDSDLTLALFETDRRLRLFSVPTDSKQCFRLAHVKGPTTESEFIIDQFGDGLILSWYKKHWGDSELRQFSIYANVVNRPIFVRLQEGHVTIQSEKPHATDGTWVAQEKQVRYEIRADSGPTGGLFLNQRLQRQWLFDHAKDKSVLSLFSQTGAFTICASLGSADQVTSVEMNKNLLSWAQKNFELNSLDLSKIKTLCRDSMTFLDQCKSKKTKFDIIVCDAPSFVRGEKKVFKIKTDLPVLLKNCLECLNPGGELLFMTNFDGFYIRDINRAILEAQKELKISNLEINCLLPSLDFELPDERAGLKSFLIRKG